MQSQPWSLLPPPPPPTNASITTIITPTAAASTTVRFAKVAAMCLATDPVLITLVALLLPLLGILIYLTHTLTTNQRAYLARLSAATAALNAVRDSLTQQASPAAAALTDAVKDLHAALADHASSLTHAAVLQREVADELKRVRQTTITSISGGGTAPTAPQRHHGPPLLHHHLEHLQPFPRTNVVAPSAAQAAAGAAGDDIDLYRRKVEALEGLRAVLETNQQNLRDVRPGEDEALYRKRVDALEGLWKVMEGQLGVAGGGNNGGGGPVGPPATMASAVKGRKGGARKLARARGSVSEVGSRRSEETLAESLMDV
ncbi:hypothetical protein IWZ03DRAFT_371056 [Phyllosticta citriasiana]|uniref:Uncharacterized protein n=1 Tax=Phyllosticta citriasiana TaxID=595635 RepID=A0ABR1KW43_9PEZI